MCVIDFTDHSSVYDVLGRKKPVPELEQIVNEYEYLKWFHKSANFGPADGDVKSLMQKQYEKETGNLVPENLKLET